MTKQRLRTQVNFKDKSEYKIFEEIRIKNNYNSLPVMFKEIVKNTCGEIPKIDKSDARNLQTEINRIGNNINQIARKLNMFKLGKDQEIKNNLNQVRSELNLIRGIIKELT